MYDVMIIDDDVYLRERLKAMIDWAGLGLRLIGEAGDSDSARELYLSYRPSIVITDIRIPFISGLELARELIAMDPRVRVIVITGYTDFAYAKDAVAIGAVELLSKPLERQEIEDSLKKATAYFEEARRIQTSQLMLDRLVEKDREALREKYISFFMKSGGAMKEAGSDQLSFLEGTLKGPMFSAVRLEPDIGGVSVQDYELMFVAIKNITGEIFERAGISAYIYDEYGQSLICLLSFGFDCSDELIEELADQISKLMEFYFGFRVLAGIGRPVRSISELPRSVEQAGSALDYSGDSESMSTLNYKNMMAADIEPSRDEEHALKQIMAAFRQNQPDYLKSQIEAYLRTLNAAGAPMEQVMKFSIKCASELLSLALTMGMDSDSGLYYSGLLRAIPSPVNAEAHVAFMGELACNMTKTIFSKRFDKQNHIIDLAKHYIEENLGDQGLNLEKVSYHVGLSRIYFCKLFHRTEQISFNAYLNCRRVEYAKRLLTGTSKKIFEISDEVGYSNAKHFGYMFKRIVGSSPLDYRKNAPMTMVN